MKYYLKSVLVLTCIVFLNYSFAQNSLFKKHLQVDSTKLTSSSQITNLQNNLKNYFQSKKIVPSQNRITSSVNLMNKQVAFSKIQSMLVNDKIIYDKETGLPIFIEPQSVKSTEGLKKISKQAANDKAKQFLNEKKNILKITDPESEFQIISSNQDESGNSHVRFQQYYMGLEVWAKDVYVHLDPYGNISSFNGRYKETPSGIVNTFSKISQDDAAGTALNDLSLKMTIETISDNFKQLLDYDEPKKKKIIWYDTFKQPHLVFLVEIRPNIKDDWYYFIDAQTGFILNKYNNSKADGPVQSSGKDLNNVTRTLGAYLSNGTYYLLDASQPMYNATNSKIPTDPVGAIECLDIQNKDFTSTSSLYYVTSANNSWTPLQVSTQYNASTTYNYFRTTFNRNSIDNAGMSIYSVIHVTENGQPMDNAYWNGAFLCFGDGNTYFKPWPGTLDLSAHEVTHGVTQYSANMEYQYQSGALNESMSDVFGAMVERKNWQLGEEIVKNYQYFPSGALRDISNPHNGGSSSNDACWQPRDMNEYVNTDQDNGGVHVNSSIPNYAFYYVATNQSKEKAEKIWYKALTEYMTRSSQFIDARLTTIKAAEALYGASSSEVTTVKAAWDNVKVFDAGGTTDTITTVMNGVDWILAYATNDQNSIYMTKPTPTSNSDFYPMSKTPVWGTRPAISDDGAIILFIDANNNLRLMASNTSAPREQILDNQGIWNSVAIGPGINSIALTTTNMDKKIYIFDLAASKVVAFDLKIQSGDSPTLTIPQYADAMAFDQSGKYLVFDAFIVVSDNLGNAYGYWTLNILEISTGKMGSVFSAVPNVYSVGNPAFAKTMPTVITYDVMDQTTNYISVMTLNMNTGDMGLVATNQPRNGNPIVGFPSYSKDDKTIAYHTLVANSFGQAVDGIAKMPLKTDHLTGTGSASVHSSGSTYPVWFVIGTRVGVEENSIIPISSSLIGNYPNPFNPTTKIEFELNKSYSISLELYNSIGQKVRSLLKNEHYSAGRHSIDWDGKDDFGYNLSSGVYLYKLTSPDFSEVKKMILIR